MFFGGLEINYYCKCGLYMMTLALATTIRDDLFLIRFLRKIDYIKNE